MNLAWYKAHCFEEFRAAVEEFNQWAELHGIEPYYDYDLVPKPSGELIHSDPYNPTIAYTSGVTPMPSDVPCVAENNLEKTILCYEAIPVYVVGSSKPITWVKGNLKSLPASGCLITK